MCTAETPLDIERFKAELVNCGPRHYSFGRKADLDAHIHMLKIEFSGKTYLEFFHAATTTFIRRRFNLDHCLGNFRRMWEEESAFMCERLDTRWLISACDTIIDHFEEPDEVATAVAGTLFMNTCKLYETERLTQEKVRDFQEVFRQTPRVALYDGMSAFVVGRGDMVKNLLHRIEKHSNTCIASPILKELIKRANTHDTVFKRFRDKHVNEQTKW